eukprot:12318280-Ditylum_brightwellii.AAC.1
MGLEHCTLAHCCAGFSDMGGDCAVLDLRWQKCHVAATSFPWTTGAFARSISVGTKKMPAVTTWHHERNTSPLAYISGLAILL